jgi:hypothetical protein
MFQNRLFRNVCLIAFAATVIAYILIGLEAALRGAVS